LSSKDLIQSGILELYALGLCSEQEASRVEEALRSDSQVRKEYEEVCEALDHLAVEQSVEPPSFLKGKIMEQIDTLENAATKEDNMHAETAAKPSKTKNNAEDSVQKIGSNKWQWLAAASIVLFMASVGLNYSFYQRMNLAEEEAALLRNNNMLLSDENGIIKTNYEVMQQQYAFLSDKNLKAASLVGTEAYPELEALIFWDDARGDLYLVTNELPALGEDEQYQLWALDNGVPKDAGLVPSDFKDGGAYKLSNIRSAQAFDITIEKKGGAKSPTLEKMVVFGTI